MLRPPRSLRRSGSLSIHPPVRTPSSARARRPQTRKPTTVRESAAEPRRSGARKRRGRVRERGCSCRGRRRDDRTSRHARCGNDRGSTKRRTRSLSCARDVHRAASCAVARWRIPKMRRSRPSPIVRVRYISRAARSFVSPDRPSASR